MVSIAEATVVYVAIVDKDVWSRPLLKPRRIRDGLVGELTVDDRMIGMKTMSYCDASICIDYRVVAPCMKSSGCVHVSQETQVFVVDSVNELVMTTDFGAFLMPSSVQERFSSYLLDLQGLVSYISDGRNRVGPVLLEDHSTSRDALHFVQFLAAKYNLPMIQLNCKKINRQDHLLEKAFFAACGHSRGIFVIDDLDHLSGLVSADDLLFEAKLRNNLTLQQILSQHVESLVIIGISSHEDNVFPTTRALFEYKFEFDFQSTARKMQDISTCPPIHSFDNLFGVEAVLQDFDEHVLWPIIHRDLFLKFGGLGSHAAAVLLHGPSGTGKTTLPQLLAHRYQCELIHMRIYDVIKSEVGSSEKAIQGIFQRARRNAPALLFIDEFNSIFPTASSLLTTFLVCLDDLREWNRHSGRESLVIVIVATRQLSAIPSQCLLPHRFGKVISLGKMSDQGRHDFFQAVIESLAEDLSVHLSKPSAPEGSLPSSDVDCRMWRAEVEVLSARTKGCNGGELQQLRRRAERRYRGVFQSNWSVQEAIRGYLQTWTEVLAYSLSL